MRWLIALSILLSVLACSRTGTLKRMTLKGTAVKGIGTKTPVASGRVQLLVPGQRGWERVVFDEGSSIPNIVSTGTDGKFSFSVEFNWWEEVFVKEDRPVFLAVTDDSETYTLLNQVPIDLAVQDAELSLNPSPQTTVAALWQCPHGVFSSPQPACPPNVWCSYPGGSPCYQLADQSTTTTEMVNAIDTTVAASKIPDPDPTKLADFSTTLLNADPTLIDKILANLAEKGFSVEVEVTATLFSSELTLNPVPFVPVATNDDLNEPASEDTSGGDETCTSYMSCTRCSISACSDGEYAWYRTSGGAEYYCASLSNCTSAAQRVVAACCSREEAYRKGKGRLFTPRFRIPPVL